MGRTRSVDVDVDVDVAESRRRPEAMKLRSRFTNLSIQTKVDNTKRLERSSMN